MTASIQPSSLVCGLATRVTCVDDFNARTRLLSRIIFCSRRCRVAAIPTSFSTRRTTRFIVRHGNCHLRSIPDLRCAIMSRIANTYMTGILRVFLYKRLVACIFVHYVHTDGLIDRVFIARDCSRVDRVDTGLRVYEYRVDMVSFHPLYTLAHFSVKNLCFTWTLHG